jgi:hypothetical protein
MQAYYLCFGIRRRFVQELAIGELLDEERLKFAQVDRVRDPPLGGRPRGRYRPAALGETAGVSWAVRAVRCRDARLVTKELSGARRLGASRKRFRGVRHGYEKARNYNRNAYRGAAGRAGPSRPF